MKTSFFAAMIAASTLFASTAAYADDYILTVKDHAFSPKELTIPAGQKVKLIIKNLDPSPIEFESYELNREKIIAANGTGVVFVGPLKAGSYPFFDEFHMDTTKGTLIAK